MFCPQFNYRSLAVSQYVAVSHIYLLNSWGALLPPSLPHWQRFYLWRRTRHRTSSHDRRRAEVGGGHQDRRRRGVVGADELGRVSPASGHVRLHGLPRRRVSISLARGITRGGCLTALLIVSSPLAETFPESVSTEVIGQSYEGRDMRVIKICGGGGGECGKKPGMYIEGGEQFGRTDGSVCPSFRLQFLSLATFVSWFGIWAQEAHTSSPKLSWCMPAIARPANRKYFERWL